MTAASNSEARKRATSPVDPVEVVARALAPHDGLAGAWMREAQIAVTALRAEGLLS